MAKDPSGQLIELQADHYRYKENLGRLGKPNSSLQHEKVGDFSNIAVGGIRIDKYTRPERRALA